MLSSARLFVDGMIGTVSGDIEAPHQPPTPAAGCDEGEDLFGRIVDVYQSNEFLFNQMKSVNQQLAAARAYLATPGSNPVLARAHLLQLKARHSAALTLLRANRLQARALLARAAVPPEAEVA